MIQDRRVTAFTLFIQQYVSQFNDVIEFLKRNEGILSFLTLRLIPLTSFCSVYK